ncbi:MAG TPA: winged helix DNA-binding domain-containing protein [Solirubrobacteraceae bacterium]|nr:winged helix DNA-binding domain-containing protein [Solirubrobacteraceae bacterium]
MAAERVLSTLELNRAVLARQHLLEPSTATIPKTIAAIGAIQSQYAPSMYVGLWSRMRDFERDALTRALEQRAVVQATLMRVTVHLVATRDYWPFALATRAARRALWLRSMRRRVTEGELEALAERVRAYLDEHGQISRRQLGALVGKQHAIGVGLWIDLVRVPPSGTWERRRADLFAAAHSWVGPAPEMTAEEAAAQLVRSYLAGFGPATRADIASYTGLSRGELAAALEQLTSRSFRSEGGEELLDVPRAALPDPEQPVPVRYLPTWDATLLVHARRAAILPEQHRTRIFHVRKPHSEAVFLVDGAAAGTWRYRDGRVELEPFERLDRTTERELRAEADRLAAFHA